MKSPYYVAVINSRGNTIPRSGIAISGDSENGYELVEDNLLNYFAIHVIDKIMQLNVIAWSYMDGIPYYKPTNNEMVGKTFTRKGLLAGILYNGISTSESVDAQFTEQKLGSDDLEIETYTIKDGSPDEDAIPTRRVIKGKHENGEGEDTEYYSYLIPNTITSPIPTYASVDKKDLELTIQDGVCEITEDIYGKMSIVVLTENTIIDSRNKDNFVLSVDARNDGEETTYYAIPFNNTYGYIVNKLGENAIINYDDYGYMKYDFTESDFITLSQSTDSREPSLKSEHPSDDDSENMISAEGWGTTGIFTLHRSIINESDMLQPYFIIAVSGVTRCISPVYELYFYNAKLTLTKRYKNNISTNEIIYEFLLEITGIDNSYYMNNYGYTVNVTSNATIDDITIEMNYDFEKEYTDNEEERFKLKNLDEEDNYTIESNFEELYNNLDRINNEKYPHPPYATNFGLNLVAGQVITTITDYCGLHHTCNLTSIELIDNTMIP